MRRPGLLLVSVLLLLCNLDGASAFTTKQSDRKRPTFSGTEATATAEVHSKRPPAFVGPSHQQQQVAEYYSWLEDEEEMEISITTALVSCVLTMALGFGIGYGT